MENSLLLRASWHLIEGKRFYRNNSQTNSKVCLSCLSQVGENSRLYSYFLEQTYDPAFADAELGTSLVSVITANLKKMAMLER